MAIRDMLKKLPNVRLLIEYAMIGLLIILSATIFGLRKQVSGLESSNDAYGSAVGELVRINEGQTDVLKKLVTLGTLNQEQLELLAADRKTILDEQVRQSLAIKNLEKQNEEVRRYLSTVIPHDLACVLNKAC